MAYVTAVRGYKGGQITQPMVSNQPPGILKPETANSYEAGIKSTLFAGWVLDLNAFYQKIGNFQGQQCSTVANGPGNTGALVCNIQNIDGVKSRGAEINLFGPVTRGLSLATGFIYAKTTYPNNFLGSDGTQIGGTQLANAPRYKFTLSGEYEQPLSSAFKGFLAGDTVWKSRIRYEATSYRETTFRPHWTVGGRIGLRTEDNRYSAGVFVRNLFNVHEPALLVSAFPYNGTANIGAVYGANSFRQIGLQLDAKF